MARIFTTPASEAAAKVLMHNVTVAGGINTNNLQHSTWPISDSRFITASQAICTELVEREFKDIDSHIKRVAQYKFRPNYDDSGKYKQVDPEFVAKAIVYLAERLNLYWDDTIRTPYEISEFQKTLLGNAVYKYGRYISAIKDTTNKATKAASNAGTPKVAASANAQGAGFKQSGPKSGQARDLLGLNGGPGKPGEKVFIDPAQGYALAIRGTKPGVKSDYCAQIKPLDPKGAAGSTNKVFISASHSYGMGICYFDDMADATHFYNNLVNSGRVPSDITNLEIVKVKVDKNGYFLFGTEFGFCAVSASVLNEDINEPAAVEEDLGSDWKKATERYTEEQHDELHSWMRKD